MAVDLLIVGAAKCGTSSLLAYLGQHPGIQPQRQLEMTWFGDPDLNARPFPDELYFGDSPRDGALRLGKLAGLMYHPDAIARLHDLSPKVNAVAILCDPVSRAYSAFCFARRRGVEPLSRFEEAIAARGQGDWWSDRFRYLEGGTYSTYIQDLYDGLGRDSVHVVIFEEFLANPKAAVGPALASVGLAPEPLGDEVPRENAARSARSGHLARARRSGGAVAAARHLIPAPARDALRRQYRKLNESDSAPPPMDAGTERDLRAHFEEPNRELEQIIGRPIEAWRRPKT
ncbi:sulfotransferase [soil metagenome]